MQSHRVLAAGTLLATALVSFQIHRPVPEARAAVTKAPRGNAALARKHCSTCHPFSPPDTLPRASWKGTIEKMSLIAANQDVPGWDAPRAPIVLSPDYAAILAYYEAEAPVALPAPAPWPTVT